MYQCNNCGQTSPQEVGKCFNCGEWNSFEIVKENTKNGTSKNSLPEVEQLNKIQVDKSERFSTQISEIDRVLGGGMILGSSILIGGEPGIGKSTLALQLSHLAKEDFKVLYISGEESLKQIKMRADRLKVNPDELFVLSDNNLDSIENQVRSIRPKLLIVDSIHTIESKNLESFPGSISQLKICAQDLSSLSKELNFTLILVAHITKEGTIAGPKLLEHLVDTVLYFEKVDSDDLRILRTSKNRFGATDEIGIFKMKDTGLDEVRDPAGLFITKDQKSYSGSIISSSHEGTRPILLEIQSLVSKPTQSFGKRYVNGIDFNRAVMLVAILEKHYNIRLSDKDIFISLTNGMKAKDTSVDLGVIASIISSFENIAIPSTIAFMGEVGLSGEIKKIANIDKRVSEISRLGFDSCVIPSDSEKNISKKFKGLKIISIRNIKELKSFF